MAQRITGREAIERGIKLITPPVEVHEGDFEAARMWLEGPEHAGYFHADMTIEDDLHTGMFFISDQTVCSLFRNVWGHGAQTVH